jgi:hypothetical protein
MKQLVNMELNRAVPFILLLSHGPDVQLASMYQILSYTALSESQFQQAI